LSADLARLIGAWPKQPEHVRRAILTLPDGCKWLPDERRVTSLPLGKGRPARAPFLTVGVLASSTC
jgi:hypothetical protein